MSEKVYLVEGVISEVTFNRTNLVENKYYFPDLDVDESNLWLNFGGFHECQLVDNLYLASDNSVVSYEFNVDEYDKPYIELVNYWEDILGSSAESESFRLKYLRTTGSLGSVSRNQLNEVLGVGQGSVGTDELLVVHPGNNSKEIVSDDGWTSPGYNPQSVEDARKDASFYVTTYDTLITSADFERASRRVVGVTASRLVDNEIIINEGLKIEDIAQRARDNFMTQEVTQSNGDTMTLLVPYVAIIYMTYLDLGAVHNMYCLLPDSDPYKFKTYDDYVDGTVEPSSELKTLGCFPYKMTNDLLMSVNEIYRNSKILNVSIEFGTTKVYPFKVAGNLFLQEPLSPADTLSICTSVNQALEEFYYPDDHTYGEPPKLLDIVKVIQGADDRISYFDAANQMLEFNPPCNGLEGFDTTSFAIYTGLSKNFNFDQKFLRFRIKNTSTKTVSLETLNAVDTVSQQYTINYKSVITVVLNNIEELKALVNDMQLNPALVYAG